ncbi:hypothetical protein B0T21DRAFT_416226 [Apiosordaria backusii]|uniref:Uncharacterized protein n=1 Tax=Apiosordaria backusii TaxID=314023 RepID=A0AA40A3Y7_9PEZI|nr:hypothetical protein B0T21DRAFT_416226 [Apiosordaria backusii]
MSSPALTSLKGWQKVENCCKAAKSEGWDDVWIDTCYKLGEAINSMFRWYEEAEICDAFLADVPPRYWSDLAHSAGDTTPGPEQLLKYLNKDSETIGWVRQNRHLGISKHVRLEISVMEKDSLANDDLDGQPGKWDYPSSASYEYSDYELEH